MKHYYNLAWRELLGQKVISVLLLAAVVLSTMLTAAVGQSAGVLTAMREQQAITIGGNRYASFVQLDEAQLAALQQDERLSYVGVYVSIGTVELNDLLKLDLTEYWGDAVNARPAYCQLMAGRLPESPYEIALSEETLRFLGYTGEIGDTISLPLAKSLRHGVMMESYDYTAEFTLTGILQNNYLGYAGGFLFGLVGEGTAAEVLPPEYFYYNADIRTYDKAGFQNIMDDLCARLQIHELDSTYNIPYLKALGIAFNAENSGSRLAVDDDGFAYLLWSGVLLVSLILLAAGLVIYNILKIAVARRVGQYGVLRAIGGTKGQLYTIVAAEVLLLCLIGIPVGILLGVLSAKGILSAALAQLPPAVLLAQDSAQLQELISANSSGKWAYLLLSGVVTLLFAFLAAAPAAHFAAEVPPVIAMSGRIQKIKRRRRGGARRRSFKRVSFERFYAWLNLGRNRGRTAITILSLVMSITVFIVLQSFLGLLSVAGAESKHLGDYSIVNQITGFSPEEAASLTADESVQAMAAQRFVMYYLDENCSQLGIETDLVQSPGETFQIFGMNDYMLERELADLLDAEQLGAVLAGECCVVRNPIPLEIEGRMAFTTSVETGDSLTIAGRKLPVMRALSNYERYFSFGSSGFTNGVQVVVSEELYAQLTGDSAYTELRPVLQQSADREAFDNLLDQLCQRVPGTTIVSYEQMDRQLAESEAQIRMLAWGLILFIGLIGVLNIINTVYTNIHTRRAEIGMQRAIGMSGGSLYRTFLWEGAYYGLIAALLGALAGYGGTLVVQAVIYGSLQLAAVPWLPMLEAAGVSVAACLLATAIPLRGISRLSIVEAIETVE